MIIGSNYHGEVKPEIEIEPVKENAYSIFERLKQVDCLKYVACTRAKEELIN